MLAPSTIAGSKPRRQQTTGNCGLRLGRKGESSARPNPLPRVIAAKDPHALWAAAAAETLEVHPLYASILTSAVEIFGVWVASMTIHSGAAASWALLTLVLSS